MASVLPKEAIEWLRTKQIKPGLNRKVAWGEEHAVAFSVAGITNASLLQDIRESLARAMEIGQPYKQWLAGLEGDLSRRGWGDKTKTQDPSRLKTIYDTNVRSARSVGQWRRIERQQRALPYLMYMLGPSKKHREEHVGYANLILPVADPFWKTAMPPNGFGCRCWVRALTAREARSLGVAVDFKAELVKWRRSDGKIVYAPVGVDPAFAYNPGMVSNDERIDNITQSTTYEES